MTPLQINCGQIWGGVHDINVDTVTSGVRASLYSAAFDGAKGGDIYYFSVCDSNLLTRIALADVVGHGEAVSLTSQWLYQALEHNMNSPDNAAVLSNLNRAAVGHGYDAITTAAIVTYYLDTETFYFSYAGHHAALFRAGTNEQWLQAELAQDGGHNNIPLGVDGDAHYTQDTLALHSGDAVFLYTDGLIEAPNAAGERFGLTRLFDSLNTLTTDPGAVKFGVLEAFQQHVGELGPSDDVTFIAALVR